MNSLPMTDLFLHIYVMIDGLYPTHETDIRKGQTSKKPYFSENEMMTVMIVMDYIPFTIERQLLSL